MFLSAGLVLTGCGDDDTATTPAPAPPPPPPAPEPEPEPMAPATPTNLHVDETTESSITWHWAASEGAVGYVVQASMDEMFDDTDTVTFDGVPFTTETHYTATDLEPETTVYLRVAAAAGTPDMPLVSEFSEAVSGMSAMPPPVPTPFMAMFTPPAKDDDKACSGYAMCPDDSTDTMMAMASVNPKMTVTVNMLSIVTPAFVEGANPVVLLPGAPNMPFAHVSWNAPQALVVGHEDAPGNGATFILQAVVMGANQIPLPVGDPHPVTCGPFECVSGMEAPDVGASDTCMMFDPTLEAQYGVIDNDVFARDDGAKGEDEAADDGIEMGWVTSSNVVAGVSHQFAGVKDGRNFSVSGPDAAKGDDKPLKMTVANDDDTTENDTDVLADKFMEAIDTPHSARTNAGCNAGADPDGTASGITYGGAATTVAAGGDALYEPDECFTLRADKEWLDGYTVELSPEGAGVTWGSIPWYKDIECDAVSIAAMDVVDICALFEDEVDQALDGDWNDFMMDVVAADGSTTSATYPSNWKVGKDNATARQFKTLWFDDDLDGDMKVNDKDKEPTAYRLKGANDLYGPAGDGAAPGARANNVNVIWQSLIDDDNDPMMGDFGKVDIDRDGMADNMDGDQADVAECSDDDGGDGCDAKFEMEYDILFADGTYGCETTRSITVTCEWDANTRAVDEAADDAEADPDALGSAATNVSLAASDAVTLDDYAKCEIE